MSKKTKIHVHVCPLVSARTDTAGIIQTVKIPFKVLKRKSSMTSLAFIGCNNSIIK